MHSTNVEICSFYRSIFTDLNLQEATHISSERVIYTLFNKTKLINFAVRNIHQSVVQIRSLHEFSLWTLQKFQRLVPKRTAWKDRITFEVYKMNTGISYWNRSGGSDSPRFAKSVVSGWASLLPASTLVGFPPTAFPRSRALSGPCARPLPPPTPLPMDLLTQRTHPTRLRWPPQPQTPRTYLPQRAHPKRHTWSSPSLPSSSRTSRRLKLLHSRLCDTNFKPTFTWKQNDTVIVNGHQSISVKQLIFVKKVQVLQGCLYLPMASGPWPVTEREKLPAVKKERNFYRR